MLNSKLPLQFTWRDRRPIVALYVASDDSVSKSATNPAGWFQDPTVDVTTPSGLANFQSRMSAYADQSISIMHDLNAQGMNVWNMDGARYGSYLGCPDYAPVLNPELNFGLHGEYGNLGGIVQDFFARFKSAGYRVGATVRATELDFTTHVLTNSSTPFETLLRKVKFAHDTWGCTIFYVDSNVRDKLPDTPNAYVQGILLPATIFARLRKVYPDCLFIPEHEDRNYHLFTAPYRELRMGETGTPAEMIDDIPEAFSVLNVSEGDMKSNATALRASFKRGDILMVNGWWRSPDIETILSLTLK